MSVVLVALALGVGVLGTLVPILPGLLLCWAAVVAYGLVEGFGPLGWFAVAVATALTALGTYLGIRIPQRDAAGVGLTRVEQLFALVLGIGGMVILPIIGLPIGFALGIFATRIRTTHDASAAWRSTLTVLRSMARASLVQTACALGIAGVWVVWAVAG